MFLTLKNLSSHTLLMNLLLMSMSVVLVTKDANLDLHLFMLFALSSMMT